jgi:hypothetical protein
MFGEWRPCLPAQLRRVYSNPLQSTVLGLSSIADIVVNWAKGENGGSGQDRTVDQLVKSQLLYR